MTTTVKVSAHLSDDKAVSILIENDNAAKNYVLQNGEEREFYAYDDTKITVNEFTKVKVENESN